MACFDASLWGDASVLQPNSDARFLEGRGEEDGGRWGGGASLSSSTYSPVCRSSIGAFICRAPAADEKASLLVKHVVLEDITNSAMYTDCKQKDAELTIEHGAMAGYITGILELKEDLHPNLRSQSKMLATVFT